jgi:hypothetical protein
MCWQSCIVSAVMVAVNLNTGYCLRAIVRYQTQLSCSGVRIRAAAYILNVARNNGIGRPVLSGG